jgi:hydroxymethylbilane synthase
MINGQVDIAVHSMKDVPTALPGIVQAAVLERATTDILVHKGMLIFLMNQELLLLEVYVRHNG